MYEKVVKTTRVFQILALILLLGLFVQTAMGQKLNVDNGILTIRKFFTTRIHLSEILGITVRTSVSSWAPFYFIETREGAYEVNDIAFMSKQGKEIIDALGLLKISINERNISHVYLTPERFNEIQKYALSIDHTDYNLGRPIRAPSLEQNFSEFYMTALVSITCVFLMLPSGYGILHPERFQGLYQCFFTFRQIPREKPFSIGSARGASIILFLTASSLLVFWYAFWLPFSRGS